MKDRAKRWGSFFFYFGVIVFLAGGLYAILGGFWLSATAPQAPDFETGQVFPWENLCKYGPCGHTFYVTKTNYILLSCGIIATAIGLTLLLITFFLFKSIRKSQINPGNFGEPTLNRITLHDIPDSTRWPQTGGRSIGSNKPSPGDTKTILGATAIIFVIAFYGVSKLLIMNGLSNPVSASIAAVQVTAPPTAAPSMVCNSGQTSTMPDLAGPSVPAEVIGFITKQSAQKLIKLTEARSGSKINPNYINNQRVMVQLSGGLRMIVLVPEGMTVSTGQSISFFYGHTDPNDPCYYIPNIIAQ